MRGVADKQLRQRLEAALSDMKRRQRFGLVFEEHVPETTSLLGFPVQIGSIVQRRSDVEGKQLYLVKTIASRGFFPPANKALSWASFSASTSLESASFARNLSAICC